MAESGVALAARVERKREVKIPLNSTVSNVYDECSFCEGGRLVIIVSFWLLSFRHTHRCSRHVPSFWLSTQRNVRVTSVMYGCPMSSLSSSFDPPSPPRFLIPTDPTPPRRVVSASGGQLRSGFWKPGASMSLGRPWRRPEMLFEHASVRRNSS